MSQAVDYLIIPLPFLNVTDPPLWRVEEMSEDLARIHAYTHTQGQIVMFSKLLRAIDNICQLGLTIPKQSEVVYSKKKRQNIG